MIAELRKECSELRTERDQLHTELAGRERENSDAKQLNRQDVDIWKTLFL
jgi:hypothetical protein